MHWRGWEGGGQGEKREEHEDEVSGEGCGQGGKL